LLMEMMALAALIASEIQERTVTAVLATPARPSDFLAAKLVVGTAVAFAQAALLLAAIGSFGRGAGPLLLSLLLGALLVTAFALIAGAQGRDFVTVVFWSMLFLIPLAIPGFGALFPGTASLWIKLIPSYGLVESMVGVTSYGDGWRQVAPHLLTVAGWAAAACLAGVVILRRKVDTL
jgi:ABC-2 type transport system permease protein